LGQGKTEEAIRVFVKSNAKSERGFLGYAYARSGRREEAESLAVDVSPLQQAAIFAGLSDKRRAFEALRRVSAVGPVRMGSILSLSDLALLGGDPRLKDLRKKVGLPE
jgi:hypothetical protein